MSVEFVLDRLLAQDEFRRQLTLDHTLPARQARYASFPEGLDLRLGQALAARGITRLYTHQAQATGLAGHIVVTNPDMLHTGVLPQHPRWVKLFANLRYVVIDELHAYRGVFGSHLANVLRRLWRVCAFYDSHPVVICCSATIANPKE